MSVDWSNELELQLLEHYKSEPAIWNTKHPRYKERSKKVQAWGRISKKMGIAVSDLKKKRDSLLSSYRKYKKIIKDSIDAAGAGGEVYKPAWFAYDYMHSFLGDHAACPRITYTTTLKTEPEYESEEKEQPEEPEEDSYMYYEPTPEATSPAAAHEPEPRPEPRRRRSGASELEEARSYIKQAVNTLNTALMSTGEDECDLYARILAGRLRGLPRLRRVRLMHELDGAVLRALSAPRRASRSASPAHSHAVFFRPRSPNSNS